MKKNIKNVILCLTLLSLSLNVKAQLHGSYIIDPSSGDYTSFTAAVNALVTQGISDEVIFHVNDGTYNESITIPQITGASESSGIIFRSSSEDSTKVILTHTPTGSGDNFTVKFDGADYVSFNAMTIQSTGNSDYGRVVCINSGSNYVQIDNCCIKGDSVTSTSSALALIDAESVSDVNIQHIRQNLLYGGSYGLYLSASDVEGYLDISSNVFENQYCKGIYTFKFSSHSISENVFSTNSSYTGYVGLHINYADSGTYVMNNKFLLSGATGIGVIFSNCNPPGYDGSPGLPKFVMFCNNVICNNSTSGIAKGIQISSCKNASIAFNSINVTTPDISAMPIDIRDAASENILLKNNILMNDGSGPAIGVVATSDTNIISDYNDLYSDGSALACINGVSDLTFSQWQLWVEGDSNSVNIRPVFPSSTDLALHQLNLYHLGSPIAGISYDIEGNLRDTLHPCLGAYEYYISMMHGTYTIDPLSAHFPTIKSAIDSLNAYGVDSAVTFNVNAGTYSERNTLLPVIGSSETNTITFKSTSGNPLDAVLTYSPTSGVDNYTLKFSSAAHYRFKNLMISSAGTTYSRVIHIDYGTNLIQFDSNRIVGFNSTSVSTDNALVASDLSETNENNIHFTNNTFINGSYGVYLVSASTTAEQGAYLVGNTFDNQYIRGVYLLYQDSAIVNHNVFTTHSTYTDYSAILLGSCDFNISIQGNSIYAPILSGPSSNGIYLLTCAGTIDKKGLIANNFIAVSGNSNRGISLSSSTYQDVYYNNIKMLSNEGALGYAVGLTGTCSNINLKNNNFTNFGLGYAIYDNNTTNFVSDYNNLYTLGSTIAKKSSTNYATLAAWRAATSKDLYSLNCNPQYFGDSNLHAVNPLLATAGTVVSEVTSDIDQNYRNACRPTIGANEISASLSVEALIDPDTVCSGDTTWLTAVGHGGSGCYTYTWTSSPAGYTSSDSVDFATPIASTKYYIEINDGSTTATDSVTVVVTTLAAKATKPNGEIMVCANQSVPSNYTTSSARATSYVWSITPSDAGAITNYGTTGAVLWNEDFEGDTAKIAVYGVNACGDGPTSDTLIVGVMPRPGVPTTPVGDTAMCQNPSNTPYTTTPTYATYSYVWKVTPANAGSFSGTGTTGTLNWNNSFSGIANIFVGAKNSCFNDTIWSDSLVVEITAAPEKPSKPQGDTLLCQNSVNTEYSINSVAGTTLYMWSLTPLTAGAIIGSDTTITINWSHEYVGTAKISVIASNECESEPSDSLEVIINPYPGKPQTPAGSHTELCINEGTTYYYTRTIGLNADSLIWSIYPADAADIQIYMDIDSIVQVDWNTAYSGTQAKISVVGLNDCGFGQVSDSLTITTHPLPGKATKPIGDTSLCYGVSSTQYTTVGAADATSYEWKIIPTWACLGPVSGTGTTGTVNWDGAFVYGEAKIFVKGKNSCGDGVYSDSLTVIMYENPGVAAKPSGDTLVCRNAANTEYTTTGATTATSYSWTITPVEAGQITGSTTTATVNWDEFYTGTAKIVVKGVNGACVGDPSDTLNVIVDPCTGFKENENNLKVEIVPNPSNGNIVLTVNGIEEKTQIQIIDFYGKLVFNQEVELNNGYKEEINLSYLSKGIYYIQLKNKNVNITNKIIIQ